MYITGPIKIQEEDPGTIEKILRLLYGETYVLADGVERIAINGCAKSHKFWKAARLVYKEIVH